MTMNAEILESIVATHLPAAAKGDQQAYGRIVAGCQNTVTSIALAIVRDRTRSLYLGLAAVEQALKPQEFYAMAKANYAELIARLFAFTKIPRKPSR
jgi:hypothetical protein